LAPRLRMRGSISAKTRSTAKSMVTNSAAVRIRQATITGLSSTVIESMISLPRSGAELVVPFGTCADDDGS
jgi:hypothetical protein